MSNNKDKVTELLVHYLHTIPEQGDADEVAEIVELIYKDVDHLGAYLAKSLTEYTDRTENHLFDSIMLVLNTAQNVDRILYFLWAFSFIIAVAALYRTF